LAGPEWHTLGALRKGGSGKKERGDQVGRGEKSVERGQGGDVNKGRPFSEEKWELQGRGGEVGEGSETF